jgi:hypothetical protein
MDELEQIKNDIKIIKERNSRVELDKAWETSSIRKCLIAVLTYIIIVIFFLFASLPRPFIGAIVPTVGFILSTFSVSYLKKIWINKKMTSLY